MHQIVPAFIRTALPRLIIVACIITEPVCTDHTTAPALLQVARRAVVRSEIEDRAVTLSLIHI